MKQNEWKANKTNKGVQKEELKDQSLKEQRTNFSTT